YEDFVNETLLSVPRRLDRVRYFRRLRSGTGYRHWGLESVYGEDAAQNAVWRAHQELITELLRTRVETLHDDAAKDQSEDLDELLDGCRKLLPRGATRAQELHFRSVLLALLHLSGQRANDRAA